MKPPWIIPWKQATVKEVLEHFPMPYPKADEPLSKLTINLYSKDLTLLRVRYGRQWQEQVRAIVRQYLGTSESEEEVDL